MEGLAEGHGVGAAHVVAILLDLVDVVGDPVEAAEAQLERVLQMERHQFVAQRVEDRV